MNTLFRTGPHWDERVRLVQVLENVVDYIRKFGYNGTVSTSEETIWAQSATLYPFPATAQSLTLSSSNAADTAAGTGARTVTVEYLDANWDRATALLSLNGQTAVSIGTGIRVNRVYVNTAGSGNTNTGILYVGYGTVTAGVPATILASVAAGVGQTLQAVYSVPQDKKAYLLDIDYCSDAKSELRLYFRPFGEAFRIRGRWTMPGGHFHHEFNFPILFPPKSDIEFRGIASAGTVGISVDFEMWME